MEIFIAEKLGYLFGLLILPALFIAATYFISKRQSKSGFWKLMQLMTGAISVFLVIAAIYTVSKNTPATLPALAVDNGKVLNSETQANLSSNLKELADNMSQQVPLRIDSVTTIVGVVSSGTRLSMYHQLDTALNPAEIMQFKEAQSLKNQKRLCSEKRIQKLIAMGMSVYQQYTDKKGNVFDVTIKDCEI